MFIKHIFSHYHKYICVKNLAVRVAGFLQKVQSFSFIRVTCAHNSEDDSLQCHIEYIIRRKLNGPRTTGDLYLETQSEPDISD